MRGATNNSAVLNDYVTEMRIAKYSEVTIRDRLRVLRKLAEFLGDTPLLAATDDDLRHFQATYAHLAPNTVNIYTRHFCALYGWARKRRRIATNPALDVDIPKAPRGRPHPASADQMRLIFACTKGALRMAYVLAAFAGLRCSEICRLRREDLNLETATATALIRGKGGHERTVPLLLPVLDELYAFGLPRAGWVVTRGGLPYLPKRLSLDSHHHLAALGVDTTLHSLRHTFATAAGRITRDAMFTRDLLGHRSVSTTEIYVQTSMADAHTRLSGMCSVAADLLGIRAVS